MHTKPTTTHTRSHTSQKPVRPEGSTSVATEARLTPTLCSRMRKACFNSTRGPRRYYAILNQPTEAVLSYPLQTLDDNQKGSPSISPLLFLSVDVTFNRFPCPSCLVPQRFLTALSPPPLLSSPFPQNEIRKEADGKTEIGRKEVLGIEASHALTSNFSQCTFLPFSIIFVANGDLTTC